MSLPPKDTGSDGQTTSVSGHRDHQTNLEVSIRKLFSDSMAYGVAAAIERGLGLFLLPLTAALLGLSGFGTIGLFVTTSMLFFNLLSLGIPSAIMRDYTQAESPEQRQKIISSAVSLMLINGFIGTILVLLPIAIASPWFEMSHFLPYAWLLCGTVSVRLVAAVLLSQLQAEGRSKHFLIVSMLTVVTSKGLAIGFVFAGYGPIGWIVGELIGLTLQLALLVPITVMQLGFDVGLSEARRMIRYGVWLVPSNIFYWGIHSVDRYLLWFLLPNPLLAIGLYGAGQRLSSIVSFANFAFKPSWRRFAFSNLKTNTGLTKLAHAATIYATGLGFLGLTLCLLGDDLIDWLLPLEFHAGSAVLLPLVLAAFCAGLAHICDIGIHQSRSTSTLMWINGLAMLINVVLGIGLIHSVGFVGAAWATVGCQLVKLVLVWRYSQRSIPIPFEYRPLVMVFAIFAQLYLLVQLIQPMTSGDGIYSLMIDGVAILAAPFLVLLTDAVNQRDRKVLKGMLAVFSARIPRVAYKP